MTDRGERERPPAKRIASLISDTAGWGTDGAIPVLHCRVADRHCAIPAARVTEVMRGGSIDALSGMPSFTLGLAVIRGAPAPVVDAGRLLNAANSTVAYLVALDVGGHAVALAVDEVIGLVRIGADVLAPLPPLLRNMDADVVAAIRARDAELLLVLDTARLVPPQVFAELRETGAAG